jgi:hypothetical protein
VQKGGKQRTHLASHATHASRLNSPRLLWDTLFPPDSGVGPRLVTRTPRRGYIGASGRHAAAKAATKAAADLSTESFGRNLTGRIHTDLSTELFGRILPRRPIYRNHLDETSHAAYTQTYPPTSPFIQILPHTHTHTHHATTHRIPHPNLLPPPPLPPPHHPPPQRLHSPLPPLHPPIHHITPLPPPKPPARLTHRCGEG